MRFKTSTTTAEGGVESDAMGTEEPDGSEEELTHQHYLDELVPNLGTKGFGKSEKIRQKVRGICDLLIILTRLECRHEF